MFRLILSLVLTLAVVSSSHSQDVSIPQEKASESKPAYERLLQGEDEKSAEELQKQIDQLSEADDYSEAMKSAEELLALRVKVQGEDHYEAVDAKQTLVALRNLAALDPEKREGWRLALRSSVEASDLESKALYAAAFPIRQTLLDWRREVLGEEHPDTASNYINLATNLAAQGRAAEAVPLYQKALDIYRRVLGEEHPYTAVAYNNLALNLDAQGKATEAAPHHQKALAIYRKVLGEEHPDTATSYNNLAMNLNDQGKVAEAAPLLQKALAIHRKVLGEEHPHHRDQLR